MAHTMADESDSSRPNARQPDERSDGSRKEKIPVTRIELDSHLSRLLLDVAL